MRGRWAAGIVPRNFCWIIKDHLAVSERPGGYAPNHRKVRRHEELLWLRAQGFTRVVSLLASTHNLHAYDELHLEWSRFAMPAASDTREVLAGLYPALHGWLRSGERVLLHQEELGDCVMGVVAGYLLWSDILPDGPRAITAMEQLLRRQMGTPGRMIVSGVEDVPSLASFISPEAGAPEAEGDAGSRETAGEASDDDADSDGRTGSSDEAGQAAMASLEGRAPGDTGQVAAGPTVGFRGGDIEPPRDQGKDPASGLS